MWDTATFLAWVPIGWTAERWRWLLERRWTVYALIGGEGGGVIEGLVFEGYVPQERFLPGTG